MPSVEKLFADSAYGGPKLALALAAMGRAPDLEIVKKHEGQQGFEVLSRRWVVERFFGWLGRCRRLAKDYERSLESSLACGFSLRSSGSWSGVSGEPKIAENHYVIDIIEL